MRRATPLLLAIAMASMPLTASVAQQSASPGEGCDAGVARRQLTGQPMTDYMAACRAGRVNPENLGKICNSAANAGNLSASARQTYLAECMKGPG